VETFCGNVSTGALSTPRRNVFMQVGEEAQRGNVCVGSRDVETFLRAGNVSTWRPSLGEPREGKVDRRGGGGFFSFWLRSSDVETFLDPANVSTSRSSPGKARGGAAESAGVANVPTWCRRQNVSTGALSTRRGNVSDFGGGPAATWKRFTTAKPITFLSKVSTVSPREIRKRFPRSRFRKKGFDV